MRRCWLLIALSWVVVVPSRADGASRCTDPAAKEKPAGRREMTWADPNRDEPAGTKYHTFRSSTIGGEVSYLLYLPPDYAQQQKRYPVLYWLHGSGATQSKGGEVVRRVDQAIRDGKLPPMIVVLVNGLRGATMYCDTKDGKWPLESVMVKDLIPHVDATYRTIARRKARAVEGFSMGGFGAAHLGFKYPEVFGVVSILAPALLGPEITAEMPRRKWADHFTSVFDGDLDCYRANDPFQLVVHNADKLRGRTIIRLVPHDEEGKWLIPRCEQLHALLEKHGIAHVFDPRRDVTAHNYRLLYDKMGEKALGFYASAFASAQGSASAQGNDWKLDRVEIRNGIEIYECRRPGNPGPPACSPSRPAQGPSRPSCSTTAGATARRFSTAAWSSPKMASRPSPATCATQKSPWRISAISAGKKGWGRARRARTSAATGRTSRS